MFTQVLLTVTLTKVTLSARHNYFIPGNGCGGINAPFQRLLSRKLIEVNEVFSLNKGEMLPEDLSTLKCTFLHDQDIINAYLNAKYGN